MLRVTGQHIFTLSVGSASFCWSVLIGAGCPSKDDLVILNEIVSLAGTREESDDMSMHSLLYSDLGAQSPLHISLSRPVVLRTEQRQSFTEALETGIRDSNIRP